MRVHIAALVCVATLAACSGDDVVIDPGVLNTQLGDPLPGLNPGQMAAFERGEMIFKHRFTRSEGHGPHFNTDSCVSCHELPVAGGSSPLYRNFYIARNTDQSNFFLDNQLVARQFSYTRTARESMIGAPIVAQRNTPPLFGIAQFERIGNLDIARNADPNDNDADGISGRVSIDDGTTGRFGYKAQEGGLEDFVRGPLFNHMGITTDPLPSVAQATFPRQPTRDDDGVPDPELGSNDIADIIAWMRGLAPPQPLPMDTEARQGETLFSQVGCAKCHIKNLVTNGVAINAYTDLLIHDMGPNLADGIVMGSATGTEFRTQPLWGLRHHAPYLHDGRADTITDAIMLHDGEGRASRNAFAALSASEQAAVIKFLETR